MKKVCIIGCFADTLDLLNGQTVKTKIVYKEMKNAFGCNEVMKVDTYGGIKTLVKTPIIVLNALIPFPKCNHSSSGEWIENYSSTFNYF